MGSFTSDLAQQQLIQGLAQHLIVLGARHLIIQDLTGITQHHVRCMSEGYAIARGKPLSPNTALLPQWSARASLFAQHFTLALNELNRLRGNFPRYNRARAFISAYERQAALPLAGETLPVDLAWHTMKSIGIGEWSLKRCMTCSVPTLVTRVIPESHVACADHRVRSLERLYRAL